MNEDSALDKHSFFIMLLPMRMRLLFIILVYLLSFNSALPANSQVEDREENSKMQFTIANDRDAITDSLKWQIDRIERFFENVEETAKTSERRAHDLLKLILAVGGIIFSTLVVYGIISALRVEGESQKIEELRIRAEKLVNKAGESVEKIEKLRHLIKNEDYRFNFRNLGYEFARQKRFYEALRFFSEALKLKRTSYGYYDRGVVLWRHGKLKEALQDFEKAIEMDKDEECPEAYDRKGIVLMGLKQGKYQEAVESHKKAIGIWSSHPVFYANLSNTYLEWGKALKEEEARDKFLEAKQNAELAIRFSDNIQVLGYCNKVAILGYYNLTCALCRLGDYDEAILKLSLCKEEGEELRYDEIRPWEDDDLAPLRKPPYLDRFIAIVGPKPPEEGEEPKAKKTGRKKK